MNNKTQFLVGLIFITRVPFINFKKLPPTKNISETSNKSLESTGRMYIHLDVYTYIRPNVSLVYAKCAGA